MSRCHRKTVPGVTISRIAARRSIGSVPASRASNARSGHVSRARAPGRSRPATASWWRSMRISASFHHASRRDKPGSDTARETIRKISFKPTSRRSSHLRSGQDRPGAYRTLQRALQGLCPGGAGFRHPQERNAAHCPGRSLQPQRCFASRCAGRAYGALLTLETSTGPAGLTARARPRPGPRSARRTSPGNRYLSGIRRRIRLGCACTFRATGSCRLPVLLGRVQARRPAVISRMP